MKYTLCCPDCGRRIASFEEGDTGEAVCGNCGAVMSYRFTNGASSICVKEYASPKLPHRIRTLKVSCPVCGKRIASSADGTYTETVCPKCKTEFAYDVKENEVCQLILKPSVKVPVQKRRECESAAQASNPA